MRISFIIVLTLFIAACGGGGDSALSESSDPIGLNGTWVSECYYDDEFDEYTREELRFSGFDFSALVQNYSNANCLGAPDDEGSFSGTFSVGSTITTVRGLEAVEIDFTFQVGNQTDTVNDIVRVDSDRLWFGEETNNGSRPNRLNFDVEYTRQ